MYFSILRLITSGVVSPSVSAPGDTATVEHNSYYELYVLLSSIIVLNYVKRLY